MLENRSFLCLIVSILLWSIACGGIVLHLPSYAASFGADSWELSIIWIIFGCSAIVSRLLSGCASSFNPVIKYYEYAGSFAVLSIATFFLPLYGHIVAGRLAYASMLGICVSICYPLLNSLTVEQVGLHNLPMALGIEMLICGTGNLLGPPIGGAGVIELTVYFAASVFERTGEYRNAMWCYAGFLMASSICSIGMLICKPKATNQHLTYSSDDVLKSLTSLPVGIGCSLESIAHSIYIFPAAMSIVEYDVNGVEVGSIWDANTVETKTLC